MINSIKNILKIELRKIELRKIDDLDKKFR